MVNLRRIMADRKNHLHAFSSKTDKPLAQIAFADLGCRTARHSTARNPGVKEQRSLPWSLQSLCCPDTDLQPGLPDRPFA